MKPLRQLLVVLAVIGASIAGGFFGFRFSQSTQFAQAEQRVQATREQLARVDDLATVFRQVGKTVEPSVVSLNVRKTVKGVSPRLPFDDEMLRRFFRDRNLPELPELPGPSDEDGTMEQIGTGSGVIIEARNGVGYILTNSHVAKDATEMDISLWDGRKITNGKVLGTDSKTDLAVIKISATQLIAAKWGDSSQLDKGDWVLAFGSPFGYVGSMTHGIVSALNRQAGILGKQGYENFIQVDAPINPGNSGGPLVNIRGEVVGINTAIASRNGGFQGIGFAIPSNLAKFVYGQLKDKGKVTRGWLGVSISDVSRDPSMAKSFGFTGNEGVLVQQTFSNTPAAGKLQEGDIITAINGKAVADVQELRNVVAAVVPGNDIKLRVFRNKKNQDVTIKVGEQPEDLTAMAGGRGGEAHGGEQASAETLGMRLATLNDSLAQRFGLTDITSGAVILQVQRNSLAAKAGLTPGDVITRVGSAKIGTASQASDALAKSDIKEGIRLYVTGAEGSRFVFLQQE